MKKKHTRYLSVAAYLALRFSLLITIIILVLSFAIVLLLRSNIRIQQNRELFFAMDRISSSFSEMISQNSETTEEILLNDELPYYILFSVYRGGSSVVFKTDDPFLPKLPVTNGRTVRYRSRDYFIDGDLNILYCAKQYKTDSGELFTVEVALNMDRDTSERLLSGLPRLMLILFFPLLLISFRAALLITRRTLKPVKEMIEMAQKISSANLSQRLPVAGTGDELDTLASTFNDLFSRLKADFDRERQFTSNVSHELKTPLAVILGHANLIRRWGKNDSVQLEKSINALITESHSMEAIITNLLLLARLENGVEKLSMMPVPVKPLLNRLADDTSVWSPETTFTYDSVPDMTVVTAEEELLYQAFTIIVSNSIKFAASLVRITVETREENMRVIITFTDTGPGIEPEILPHIFERFYRGDPSHNRNAGGSGLGLSIAKVIMDVMHGSISAGNAPEGGAVLTLALPAVQK
jgi:two-component system, OmpR family, sensor histidine kinase ArlS